MMSILFAREIPGISILNIFVKLFMLAFILPYNFSSYSPGMMIFKKFSKALPDMQRRKLI
jgi:hypothetical protein